MIESFLTLEQHRVLYGQGLELNPHASQPPQHAQFVNYNAQQYQQYGQPPLEHDPYRQSYQTGSSPAFSTLTPASDGKMPFGGPPSTVAEKPEGEHVNLRIGKRKLWLILGALATILVIGLSLGLGLGLGLSQSGGGDSSR
jgi:hypothetical protein